MARVQACPSVEQALAQLRRTRVDFAGVLRLEYPADLHQVAEGFDIATNLQGGADQLQALDLISDELTYRVQEPGDDFGDWAAVPASGIANLDIEEGSVIEVRDESGNVASTSDALQGRPNAATSGGCGCTTAGSTSSNSPLAMLGAAAMVAVVAMRRRRRIG